ncbi:MAG: hypothetical protein ACR2NY_00485 [Alphaproteobacteria bacterium]
MVINIIAIHLFVGLISQYHSDWQIDNYLVILIKIIYQLTS